MSISSDKISTQCKLKLGTPNVLCCICQLPMCCVVYASYQWQSFKKNLYLYVLQ